jgi:uncharacterized protein YabN with tetrapyrrole methylase and pyrophosphatase domain
MMNQPGTEEPFDLYIVGLGIVNVRQITHEVEAVLRRSKEILFVDRGYGIAEYLEQMCQKVTNLAEASYQEEDHRLNAYNKMTAMVLQAALDHSPVTFAIYGHPMVFVYPTLQVIQAAPLLGLRVQVLPGISTMDCLFIDLKLDPSSQGLQIYEATDLLLRQRPLQPDVACFILQIGTIESRLYSEATSTAERFSRIKTHLLKFYPPEHKVKAVYSSTFPLSPSIIIEFPIGEIELHFESLHPGATVYIPPLTIRPIADRELLSKIDSVTHLRQITTPTHKP